MLGLLLLTFSWAGSLQAQFLILASDDDNVDELFNGSQLTLSSEGVGALDTARITIVFEGPDDSVATVEEPAISGSRTFSATTGPPLPHQLVPGDSIDFQITFNPTGVGPFSARLTLRLIQNDIGREPVRADVVINLRGVVADYSVSFQLEGGNETLLPENGVIAFEDTELDVSSTAIVIVTNRGSGPGTVTGVQLDGGGVFEASGLQLLPTELQAEQSLQFTVIFTPEQEGDFVGSMLITFKVGSRAVGLTGRGVDATLRYEIITGDTTTPVPEGGTITLDPTPVEQETTVVMRVTNVGTIEGTLRMISVTGPPFGLRDTPLLPLELEIGQSFLFRLDFVPIESGIASGQLRIGDVVFDLVGQGLGAEFEYTASFQGESAMVSPGGNVIFPQTNVGASSSFTFQVKNTGNVTSPIGGIGVAGPGFLLSDLPQLPLLLQADQAISFVLTFEPESTGPLAGNLAIDDAIFNLSGVGAELPPLPEVLFSDPGRTVGPGEQVAIGLSLAEPYPVDLEGSLTLIFASEVFSDDPAVQFSVGGRTAPFTIDAGETQAEFIPEAAEAFFQTGTVAGTIGIIPSFQSDGGVDVTPDPRPNSQFTVLSAAPQLREVQVAILADGNLSVQVTGFATNRMVNTLELQFAGTPGSDLRTTSLTADVTSSFTSWYQNPQSTSFGSQFTATVSLLVTGDENSIQSVTVTATNELGTSEPITGVVP